MTCKYKHAKLMATARLTLRDHEDSYGLGELSPTERDILYAAALLMFGREFVRTCDVQEHRLVDYVTRPTFFRSLKKLVNSGHLIPSGHGRYKFPE